MAKKGDTAKFQTIGGATVMFEYENSIRGRMTCNGCKSEDGWAEVGEANKHAAECRAL